MPTKTRPIADIGVQMNHIRPYVTTLSELTAKLLETEVNKAFKKLDDNGANIVSANFLPSNHNGWYVAIILYQHTFNLFPEQDAKVDKVLSR
jgi:hypothetical protein